MKLDRYDFDRRNTINFTGKMDFNQILADLEALGVVSLRIDSGNIQWKRDGSDSTDWATLFTIASVTEAAANAVKSIPLTVSNGSLTATTTINVIDIGATKTTKLLNATYYNVTGLADSATNNFAITIQADDTVLATFDTATDAIPAGKAIIFDIDTNVITDKTLKIVFTETGEATLPAGTFTLLLAPLEDV